MVQLDSILNIVSASLGETAANKGSGALVERDLQRAMEAASGARSARVRLARWPAVGSVDLMLSGKTAVELKWCRGGDTLANCAWDVAKLGCALAERQIVHGFIAAGAPDHHWDGTAAGVRLFEPRVYDSEALVRDYESWWRFWCKDVQTRPIELPAAITVSNGGSVGVELAGDTYCMRWARVEVADGAWRTHICPHRWRAERCPPRPWDPEGWGGMPE